MWDPGNSTKSAFEVLVRACPKQAWVSYRDVLRIIEPQVQPKAHLDPQSTEAINNSYAAQRGEEALPVSGEVDVRLSLLAITEGWIRHGAANWECSRFLADAFERLMKQIVIPNLSWKVGRVEATVRKVALAASYALLKAGAVPVSSLFAVAPELVPLTVSNLDDFDATPRLMCCHSLRILFERLRGAFGDQAISETYPKLLKRLDDSSDDVREAICGTLVMFYQCAPSPKNYCNGGLDYSLDQLFVHLDDPTPTIQTAVKGVILQIAKLNKDKVIKKAESNRISHRTPALCDSIITEVQGYEILSDNA
jgi:dynein assembly factor 5